MDFFKRYNSIGGSHQQSAAETIQRLADRVATSTLLEDKRAAVLGLKGLSREYKKEVGDASLAALLKVLKEDGEDQNLLKAVLETLTNLCAREPAQGESKVVGAEAAASTEFSQAILDDSDDIISTLLELLGDADFYIRYYTVQLLGTLHVHFGEELQRRTLVSPMGVGRLVDLLTDQRDIIRNEGIQLLIAMTESNADIQKIVAFENAFDHLLGIVDEEGGVRGNIVVQDCLQLLHNLLNYNVSNQNFFREASGIQRLPNLLITDPSQTGAGRTGAQGTYAEDLEWTAQHARNMLVVLDVIRMLIQHGNTNTASNQTAMQQFGLIPPLLQLALAHEAPSSVRSQALYAIGDIIRMHQANQSLFQRILITAAATEDGDDDDDDAKAIPEPAIVIVIRLSVGKRPAAVPANEYYIVRAAAAYLVQAYAGGNPDAQLALAATLVPPGDDGSAGEPDEHQSAGSLIVSVLLNWREAGHEDVWRVWYASLLLSTILSDHAECKKQALKIAIGDPSKGEEPLPLLNELVSQARQAVQGGAETRLAISLLALVCVWLVNFPEGVAAFLDESSNVAFLVEQINGSSGISALVQGVAAFLFGLVYQFDTEPDTPMTRESLYPILSKRVGTDQLLIRVQRLRDAKEFQYAVGLSAGTHSSAYGGIPVDVYFDGVFTDLFKKNYEGFRAAVRLGPSDALANPNYAHLQGGMAGYAGSMGSGSTPGTPALAAGVSLSRAASPAAPAGAVLPAQAATLAAEAEPTVTRRELDAQSAQLVEQASQIEALRRELAEARLAQSTTIEASAAADERFAQERELRTKAEAERDTQTCEIDRLRDALGELQAQASEATQQGSAGHDAARLAELESQVAGLKLEAGARDADWSAQRDELQKKLANAEKQVVKAAAAGRNTSKKKDQQQTVALESLKGEVKTKDEQIAKLSRRVDELTEQVREAAGVDELKSRIAGLEKEQEDLLVYLADQDLQAKEYRARLRKHGEDIPLSDDDGDGDDE
ncbi:Vesicle-mediated ER to Golgi transport protein [Coemansia biformis]|uniref:General vesicular transport factor p115 n=1 Tax=Coemansia biformis TaxID=1286918 RepID=A0A9W7Y9H5_9FUNG|nr:Vesicle-mediated ER to Golgi transport protein [Coemansia biformis]